MIRRVSGKNTERFVSNHILFWQATWLNLIVTLERVFLPKPGDSSTFRKLPDWQNRDWGPFILCHFCLSGEGLLPLEMHRICCRVHNTWLLFRSTFRSIKTKRRGGHTLFRGKVTPFYSELRSKMWFLERYPSRTILYPTVLFPWLFISSLFPLPPPSSPSPRLPHISSLWLNAAHSSAVAAWRPDLLAAQGGFA